MCDYCGCRGVPAIGELLEEHTALMDLSHHVHADLAAGNPSAAMARLNGLVERLDRHVQREEDGIFRAMRTVGAALDPASTDFAAQVTRLLDDLEVHVQREDLGIFPVSVVTLGATGWAIVDQVHTRSPSFLRDQATTTASPS